MADTPLNSYAEKRALAAVAYEGFGVNLSEIKRTTADILSQIGKNGFFAEYSKHDISHIDEVLRLAEWLVDDNTKKYMTDADWFLITLSIYFHDMGMLVTREEFDAREQSGFNQFCDETLFTGPRAAEYKARVEELPPHDRDVFLYQEFVRFNHARRVRQWIDGTVDTSLGLSHAAVAEIQRVLFNLDPTLRRDLGLIAESHHLDDLDDLNKYKLVQPYGSTDAETANIQYCAIVLRAADLLHMRRDRTPSVLFRIINPTDPVSQREWSKQNAVRRVMPRMGLNDDKIPDESAPKDTIEIHARFTDENGFFGLTSFLSYVASELRKSHDWAEASKKSKGSKYSFIWKKIADDQIETEGFLKRTYSFDLDQYKILDLLIGHTLYNDTGVVLRELAQNGIDAIRLLEEENQTPPGSGLLTVTWDSTTRILVITDNGTGMTQDIIEKHLLKVGSSRYQDQKFLEEHPTFSAISRFGIGVLSTFMISDEVDITTCSADEEQARKISLRSVHGRYLVRLLDKARDPEGKMLAPHGTQVRLKVRSTAKLQSVLDAMRQWIVIPRCTVTVSIDGAPQIKIGYKSVTEAIQSFLEGGEFETGGEHPQYKVVTRQAEGVEFAYAAQWSAYYRDWTIASIPRDSRRSPVPCTCVEGISVTFGSPAMNESNFVALANARGHLAPKTNVARSTLEATPQRDALYSTIYGLYVEHVKMEIERLMQVEHYSLTWAANNAITLLPFNFSEGTPNTAILPTALREKMKELPVYIVERDGQRRNLTFHSLLEEETFWTVESYLVRSAEGLVREAKANSTVSRVIDALGDGAQALPTGTILFNMDINVSLRGPVESEFEPIEVVASETLRRVDLKWSANRSNWIRTEEVVRRATANRRGLRTRPLADYLMDMARRRDQRRRTAIGNTRLWLASPEVPFKGMDNLCGVIGNYRTLVRGDTAIAEFLRKLIASADEHMQSRLEVFSSLLLSSASLTSEQAVTFAGTQIRRIEGDMGGQFTEGSDAFLVALQASPLTFFDTSVWSERTFDF